SQVKNVIRGMSSQRDRAILVRFYLDEEDKETICRDLGLSPLQFDKILHRARGRLRKLLEAEGLRRSALLSLCPFLGPTVLGNDGKMKMQPLIDDPTRASRYLADQLSEAECAEYEARITEDPDTVAELEATARLKIGLQRLRRSGELSALIAGTGVTH